MHVRVDSFRANAPSRCRESGSLTVETGYVGLPSRGRLGVLATSYKGYYTGFWLLQSPFDSGRGYIFLETRYLFVYLNSTGAVDRFVRELLKFDISLEDGSRTANFIKLVLAVLKRVT